MKVMVVGSTPPGFQSVDIFQTGARRIGYSLAALANTELIVCSPFQDALDRYVVLAAIERRPDIPVHAHYPAQTDAAKHWTALSSSVISVHPHEGTGPDAWFLAQVHALREAQAILILGGKLSASARLLVAVAQERRVPVLPYSFAGGLGAAVRFDSLVELRERLGDHADLLDDLEGSDQCTTLIELLADPARPAVQTTGPSEHRFFISYARAKPEAADLVEAVLRREGCLVFRDEHAFGAGEEVPRRIRHALANASVFIALWSAEYACSPHCFDEIEEAIRLRKANGLPKIWIIRLDETRIVPPEARKLLFQDAFDRPALERVLALLLMRAR